MPHWYLRIRTQTTCLCCRKLGFLWSYHLACLPLGCHVCRTFFHWLGTTTAMLAVKYLLHSIQILTGITLSISFRASQVVTSIITGLTSPDTFSKIKLQADKHQIHSFSNKLFVESSKKGATKPWHNRE